MIRTRYLIGRAAPVVAVLLSSSPLYALSIPWNGGRSSNWHFVDNWDIVIVDPPWAVHRVPGDGDIALLSTPANDFVTLGNDTAPINGLSVSNGIDIHTNGFLLQVEDGGSGYTTVSGTGTSILVIPLADDPANLALQTDTLSLASNGKLLVQGGHGQVEGLLAAIGGGQVNVTAGSVLTILDLGLASTGGGTVNVSVSGSAFDVTGTGSQYIGTAGIGALTISQEATASFAGPIDLGVTGTVGGGTISVFSGAELTTASIGVGGGRGLTTGAINIDGSGSQIVQQGSARLTVGGTVGGGNGTVTVKNRGAFYTGTGQVAIGETGLIQLITSRLGGGVLVTGGNILVDGGGLYISQESTLAMPGGSKITAQNGGVVQFDDDYILDDSRSIELAGTAGLIVGGDLDIGSTTGGGVTIDGSGTTISVGGPIRIGLFGGIGSLTIQNGASPFLGAVTIAAFNHPDTMALVTVKGGASAIVFAFFITGSGQGSSASVLVKDSGSSISQATNAQLVVGTPVGTGSATLDILLGGTFTNNGGAGDVTIYETGTVNVDDATFNSKGQFTVEGGTLHVFEGGSVNLSDGASLANNGGTITGGGTIDLGGRPFLNSGNVAPGDSTGELTLNGGGYLQGQDGTLTIELAGVAVQDYDSLFVGGSALLRGTLEVLLVDAFEPQLDDLFTILLAPGGVTDTFSTEQLPLLSPGLGWTVIYGPNYVNLQVVPYYAGDLDDDDDVDLDDSALFIQCINGPDVLTPPVGCGAADFANADLDNDFDVDLADVDRFLLNFTGQAN